MSTRAPAPTPSARRAALAGLISLLVPGAGHALLKRHRTMLVFLVPVVLLIVAILGYYAGGGLTAVVAFLVTPGVLPALAVLNIALALWRIAAAVDAARQSSRPNLAYALLGPAILVLVIAPHVWAGSAIGAANDFLDSMFAAGNEDQPTETEPPIDTPPPGWTIPPDEDWFTFPPTAEPSTGPSGPPPTKEPRDPLTSGLGSLPGLGTSVPWQRPGEIPWGDDRKFDLLLLGSDAGPYRWSRRMDVMLLVEIDVASGKVAMIGVPRNIQNAPFPPGPARDAVTCGCFEPMLNALYVEATVVHPKRWPGEGAVAGIGAVRSVMSELTGRPIDAVLVADLWGVIKVVDAMGGIDIDVPAPVYDAHYPDPVLGNIELYIKAGKQHLNGRLALAYARSRHQDSDYGRMARQQTLLLAIRDDIGPKTILDAPALFKAAKGFAWTDLPRESLPNLVTLFGKAADASVSNLRIVPPKYPAWLTPSIITKVQKNVAELVGEPWPPPTPTPAPTAPPPTSPEPSAAPT